jgi:hypothetical protein
MDDWVKLGRVPFWPGRWPYIALKVCSDHVLAAPKEEWETARYALPCKSCPEIDQCLTAKEQEVSSLLFDREYRTRPRGQSSSLFPRERMEPMLARNLALVDWYRKPNGMEQRYLVGSAWDIAWSERTGGDWLAKMTGRLDQRDGTIQVLDVNRWQRLSFEEQCALIEAEWARYQDDFVVIEEASAQLVWRQYLSANSQVPVVGHGVNSKQDLQEGVPGLLFDVERKRWTFPYEAGTRNHDVMRQFLSEVENFGWSGDKLEGVGEHDDMVIAWWHLRWGFERYRVPAAKVHHRTTLADRGVEL